ncbi:MULTISPECIES: hypothetical protein [Allobacillus]|uniref:Uncharacterized protein n=1 Tax=Allobacillus salarius TaxID=1955272 RepID=A0A556PH16_9BACI|nr:hypothetical protein [Allobacillus salarius]TSJ63671.1 hypothetical protein FPQ13_08720 [Allobacillus salarius]
MRVFSWWLVVTIIVVIGGLASYFVVEANSDDSVFRSISHTGANKELFNNYEEVYIGKEIKWDGGDSLPLIKDIQLIKQDGEEFDQSNSSIQINLYIDDTGKTNVHYRDTYENKLLKESYQPVQDYQMDSDRFTLVFETSLKDQNYQYHLKKLLITYIDHGKEKQTELPLRSFIFNN